MRRALKEKSKYFARVLESKNGTLIDELKLIGVDPRGIKIIGEKGNFLAVKLLGVKTVAANILKQEVLSRGGEAAVTYGSVNLSKDRTDVIVLGTQRILNELSEKLKQHQFDLPQVAAEIKNAVTTHKKTPPSMIIGGKKFNFAKRTYLMGILNVTPDSFSDGGQFYDVDAAVTQGLQMEKDGADIIDVGGESTRPGSDPVTPAEEIERVVPVIKALKKRLKIPISIDTYKAKVAEAALRAGAQMVNDISGLRADKNMAKVIARYKIPVCVMHMQGNPKTMQRKPSYRDLISEIYCRLKESIEIAKRAGILVEQIMVDPGIGFGKSVENNYEIVRRLNEFRSLGCPILIGPSRKSFLGKVLNLPAQDRLEGTAAAVTACVNGGANVVRVHDGLAMKRVVVIADKLYR